MRKIFKRLNRNKKALVLGLAVSAVALSVFSVLGAKLSASARTAVSDLFSTSDATLTEASTESGRKGLKLVGNKDGAKVSLVDDLLGDFSAEFGFGDSSLKEVTVAFEKTDGEEAFSVIAERIDGGYNVAVQAFGEKAGIYYALGSSILTSEEMNAQGVYTEVDGEFLTLKFQPDEMKVWANDVLVWDFTVACNAWRDIGGTFDPMTAYNAAFVFERAERENGIYLYELMGERLDTPILVNRCGPNLFADVAKNAKVGEAYLLPYGYAYDLIDGKVNDIYVSVEKIEGRFETTVVAKQKMSKELYANITQSGEYKITYYATDSSGISGEKEYYFQAEQSSGEISFTMDQASFPEKIGTESSIILPTVSVFDSLYKNETRKGNTLLTVAKDGSVLQNYENVRVEQGKTFRFEQTGKYTFTYSAEENAEEKYSIEFSVTDSLPQIDFPFVAAEYVCDETLTIGDVSSAFNGKTQNVTVSLTYPDGVAKVGKSLGLSQHGLYALNYRSEYENRIYTFTRYFETVDELVSVSSSADRKIAYTSSAYTSERGLGFYLEGNETLVYNGMIDFTKKSADESLIELYVVPQLKGNVEVEMIDFILTDAYDESNFITVRSYSMSDMTYNYVTAGVKNNRKVGYNDGVLQTWAEFGTQGKASHSGVSSDGKYYPVSFSFDYQTGKIYTVGSSSKVLVTDLTNASEHEDVFEGFTDGKAYLTIKLYSLFAPRANFLLRSINGEILTDLYKVSTPEEVVNVDTLGYEEDDLPVAQVGKAYALFAASCQEKNGKELLVRHSVYYHYGQADQTNILVSNGAFIPQYAGEYSIVYTAVTSCGKKVQKVLNIQANLQSMPVSVSIDEALTSGKVGERTQLVKPAVSGGTGKTSVEVAFVAPSGEKGTISEYSFIPYENGTYTITYTVYDYLGKAYEKNLSLLVEENLLPQFEERVDLPKYFVNGKTYALPQAKAIDYSEEIKEAVVSLYVLEGNRRTDLTDYNYTPNLVGGGTVTLVYTAAGMKGENEICFEIPVKDISSVNEFYEPEYNLKEYFIGENLAVSADQSAVYLTSTGKGAYFEYIYPLMAKSFTLKFNFAKGSSTANSVSVWLTDSENEDISWKLSFRRNSGSETKSYVSLNDGVSGEANGSLYGTGSDFNVKYDNEKRIVTDNLHYSYIINYTYDGANFQGFPSGKVVLRVEYEETGTANTKLVLKEINYQLFTNEKLDEVAPQIAIASSQAKYIALGATEKIPLAIALDVLDENVTFTMSGVCNGKTLQSVDGVFIQNAAVKQYEIKFNEVGMYTFTYVATDRMGNTERGYVTLYVIDTVPPVITVSAKKLSAKVGEAVTLPNATAIDGTEKVEVVAVVIRPDLVIENVVNGKYTPQIKGKHIVRFISVDASGNVARVDVELEVK